MPELAIEIRGACKRYPGFSLEGLSLSLEKGYVLGLIGPNGAGKTTTIRLLMGLARADSGEIRVLGEDPRKAGPALRARLGFVYDESKWYGTLNARETAAWVSRLYPTWSDEAFGSRLEGFGLDPGKKIDELSKGQRMKLSLAVALSHGAELIVMDEPTGDLDRQTADEILRLLQTLNREHGKTIVMVTHDPKAAEYARRQLHLDKGTLVNDAAATA